MDTDRLNAVVSRLDGYVDALASLTRKRHGCTAAAFCIELDVADIDTALARLFSRDGNGDETDIAFENATIITDWLRPLHKELEQLLLPPQYQLAIGDARSLKLISDNLAWHVMDMIPTTESETPQIYRANYVRNTVGRGVVFVIPLADTRLLLNFCRDENA